LSKAVVETAGDAFRLEPGQVLPSGLSPSGISELFSTEPPISLYGMTKLASEGLALEYENAFGFPVWINRCGLLAGAGQFGRPDQGIFAYWINSWLRRRPLKYIGFGGEGHQVRDGLHPRDLVPLLRQQVRAEQAVSTKIVNLGGGHSNALSLAELSRWCNDRLGAHQVGSDPNDRPYDVPWLIMDSALAKEEWGWQPQTPIEAILEEIAEHAEQNPNWLTISGLS
jgi:CDP-paratose 2-epimerase